MIALTVRPNTLTLEQIKVNEQAQSRVELNQAKVDEYAEEIKSGAEFPPVIVYFDGGTYWLSAGFHRYAATQKAGLSSIAVEVREGTLRDAILNSLGENATHGLPRTNADKRKAVMTMLEDGEWSKWSDREISRRCAVGNKMVSNLRASVSGTQIDRYVERSGTIYLQNTTNIGNHKKDYIESHAPEYVKAYLEEGEISLKDAYESTRIFEEAPEPVQEFAIKHKPRHASVLEVLPEVAVKLPELFERMSVSGAVDSHDGIDIPVQESTGRDIKRAADDSERESFIQKRILNNAQIFTSESDEWYTPKSILNLVVNVLGTIDLDPCSNEKRSVPATTHYARFDNGLNQSWSGRVFMNPPYGNTITDWISKLVESFNDGDVSEAIALVPARTDTAWMRQMSEYPRCFIHGRLTFSGHANAATFPSMLIYLGDNVAKFAEVFSSIGDVYVHWSKCIENARLQ